MKTTHIVQLVGGILVAVVITALIVQAVYQSIEAERNYQAELITMRLIVGFVEKERRWPADWDELQAISPHTTDCIWQWPADISEVKKRITIDFGYDIHEIENETTASFNGFYSLKSYAHSERWLSSLKSKVRNLEEASSGGGPK